MKFRVGGVAAAMVVLLCLSAVCAEGAAHPASPRPNILLILTDDMGFSDLGCFGGEIGTPNIDALAANGLRFTQFYNMARCCPSRASLLTGLYPHQAGMGHMNVDRVEPGYRGDLNEQCVTVAEVLREAGYRNYAVGKWHVALDAGPQGAKHNWPLQRGFDKFYGLLWGYSSFYDPGIVRGNTWYSCENDPEYKPREFYFTNALSDNAVTFLQQHGKEAGETPFFMYMAYTAAHWPMHALEKDIAKYKGRFDAGYDKLRQERLKRLKQMGLIDPRWPMTLTAKEWDNVRQREWELRCMEVYAAMIDCMDQGIGRIVAELKRQGRFDNTLILFLHDNGGCAEERGRRRGGNGSEAVGTLRPLRPDELPASSVPRQTRDGRPVRTGPKAMPGPPDTYIAYGQGWANVSNTPFREYKHWVHEGGIATPLIAHWPAGIPKQRANAIVTDPGHLIDIMATCVDVAQTSYPAERRGVRVTPMEGVSLRPAFEGKPLRRGAPLFWEHESNRAVRDGKWKLVAKADKPWELYDMEADRTETHDLATSQPQLVKDLERKWDEWAKRCNVLPLGTWRNKPLRRSGAGVGQPEPAKQTSATASRPNVVVIVADDLGYADLGIQGSKDVRTPHIDSIARNGIRFTSGYVSCPVCGPTRAALMTGRYAQRFGFETNNGPEVTAVPHFGVPREERMMPEYFKAGGYATGMVGKWHLGFKPHLSPPRRGFDSFFGFLAGYHGYFPDQPAAWSGPVVRGSQPVDEKEYLTDALGREAVSFIDSHAEKPFLLYLAFNAVHAPLQPPREQEAWLSTIADPARRRMVAMISAMDTNVGRVLQTLRDRNLMDNTLIFFLSDNGGAGGKQNSRNEPLRGHKGQLFEGGIRVPFLVQWNGRVPAGRVIEQPVIAVDILPTVMAAAGIDVPARAKLDGANLLPLMEGRDLAPPHNTLYWRFYDKVKWRAIRRDNWKLVSDGGPWQLYDLAKDLEEKSDLAGASPDKVTELDAAWSEWNAGLQDPKWEGRMPPKEPEGTTVPK